MDGALVMAPANNVLGIRGDATKSERAYSIRPQSYAKNPIVVANRPWKG